MVLGLYEINVSKNVRRHVQFGKMSRSIVVRLYIAIYENLYIVPPELPAVFRLIMRHACKGMEGTASTKAARFVYENAHFLCGVSILETKTVEGAPLVLDRPLLRNGYPFYISVRRTGSRDLRMKPPALRGSLRVDGDLSYYVGKDASDGHCFSQGLFEIFSRVVTQEIFSVSKVKLGSLFIRLLPRNEKPRNNPRPRDSSLCVDSYLPYNASQSVESIVCKPEHKFVTIDANTCSTYRRAA